MKLLYSIGGVWHIKNGIAQFNSSSSFTSSFSWSHGVEIISEGDFYNCILTLTFSRNSLEICSIFTWKSHYNKLMKSRESSYILRRPHNFQKMTLFGIDKIEFLPNFDFFLRSKIIIKRVIRLTKLEQ